MDLGGKLRSAARRSLPVGEFDDLIRSIGECKSKGEEDLIVSKMIKLAKNKARDPRRDPKEAKELLIYLMYIEMLGHETSWAQPIVIQLCSDKNLAVKKVGKTFSPPSPSLSLSSTPITSYLTFPSPPSPTHPPTQMAYLATSLLVDPRSELTIMVTATIQADLKSDNFLIICTALQAICTNATPELISVFLPQVTALLRTHDKDAVKKKALLTLHRFLQMDPTLAPEIDSLLIDKVGYKEPSVMIAALPGLKELMAKSSSSSSAAAAAATTAAAPQGGHEYKKLLPFFLNILKQAAEGRLGKSYEYHHAQAPFLQLKLLKLLGILVEGDSTAAANVASVLADVKKRAESLKNTMGNALALECIRTLAKMGPSAAPDALVGSATDTVARFLASKDSNLRYAGVDGLSHMIYLDPSHVAAHQLALVDCLRSTDDTLRRKTLNLLYSVASPANIDLIAKEALACLKEESAAADEVAQRAAAADLCVALRDHAPSAAWYVAIMSELLQVAGGFVPVHAADDLLYTLSTGRTGRDDDEKEEEEGDAGGVLVGITGSTTDYTSTSSSSELESLRREAVQSYLTILSTHPKIPSLLLKVICWVVGEYGGTIGIQGDHSVHGMMDRLAAIPDTHTSTADDAVRIALITAIGKLAINSHTTTPLTPDAAAVLDTASRDPSLALQQRAAEVRALLTLSPSTQAAAIPSKSIDTPTPLMDINPNLPFLDDFVSKAEVGGATPYLTEEQRTSLGMSVHGLRHHLVGSAFIMPSSLGNNTNGGALKYEAYQATQAPTTVTSATNDVLGLDFGGMALSSSGGGGSGTAAPPPPSSSQPFMSGPPQLVLNKPMGRKWGPTSRSSTTEVPDIPPPSPSQEYGGYQQSSSSSYTPSKQQQQHSVAATAVDPEKQRLAASLFGTTHSPGKTPSSSGRRPVGTGASPSQQLSSSRQPPQQRGPEMDLLGGFNTNINHGIINTNTITGTGTGTSSASPIDILGGLDVSGLGSGGGGGGGVPSNNGGGGGVVDLLGGLDYNTNAPAAPASAAGSSGFGGLDDLLGGGGMMMSPSKPAASPQQQRGGGSSSSSKKLSDDPFGDLLG